MKIQFLMVFFFVFFIGCTTPKKDTSSLKKLKSENEMLFDKEKWNTKEGQDYPYRDKMLNNIVYNDSVRALTKVEILKHLGEPNRSAENHLYYTITLVIKFTENNTVDWFKIHE